jgi:large repetitive protein
MVGCLLCGVVLAPVMTMSQAGTTFGGRCFTYDGAGRLVSVRDQDGQVRSYGLDPASNRKGVVTGSGVACAGAGVPAPASASAMASGPALGPSLATNNSAPVTLPDSVIVSRMTEGQPSAVSVLVLANDSDPDVGDLLEVTAANYDSSKVQVTRVRSLTSGTRYNYLDIVGVATGSSIVHYMVSDGRGGQAIGFVNVTVVPPNL